CLAVTLHLPGGKTVREEVPFGDIRCLPLEVGEEAEAELHPARGFDVGRGRGHALRTTLYGGVVGILLDCRGRPLALPSEPARRWQKLREWALAVDLYPRGFLEKLPE
ncbi:MAG: methylaspartate mutase, partial [Bacillota bacterium]